jgi:hypothetical protein
MKKHMTLGIISILLLLTPAIFAEGAAETTPETAVYTQTGETAVSPAADDTAEYPAALPAGLTLEEYEGLLLMREEEKLARDVYLTLGEIWNMQIFFNIAGSEETHMNAVKPLLTTYGIEDPITTTEIGVFADPDLTALYNSLVEQGSASLTDALLVGATVEDLDIKDLQELLEGTDKTDITFVYENLLRGSENHIRSFTDLLSRSGVEYEAQFTEAEYLENLLGSDSARGRQPDVRQSAYRQADTRQGRGRR